MKIKIFEPPLPLLDVEQMSNGGEVEPPKMFGGGNIGNFNINVDPGRIAAYMANNPIVADTVGQAPPQRVTAGPVTPTTSQNQRSENPIYIPSEAELAAIDAAENPTSYNYDNASRNYNQFDRGDYVRSQDPEAQRRAAEAARAAAAERAREEAAARAAEAEAEAARVAAAEAEFARRISAGELSAQEIQDLIAGGVLTEDQVLAIIQNYQLSEDQLAQLYTQGLLTEEQILALVEGEVADQVEESEASSDGIASALTEDQINELIAQGLADQDMTGYATTDDIAGLENLFQNYLTTDQLEGYVTADQLAEATDYDKTIQALTDQLGDLETKYQDVTSQYEADAVNQQISDTKDELNNYFAASAPTGPRTGSTSQFSSGTSFLPGGSPMASLIEGQREGQGQDPFTSYLKTFTPSYSAYDEPFTPEEYNERNQPFTGGMYNNPFTGGMSYNPDKKNMGGQVSNGIMDLTNFDTNVQPFQNAFRPNVPRN